MASPARKAAPTGSTVLFRTAVPALVLAATLSSQLHEFAHGIAGAVLGLRPRVLPFAVTYGIEGSTQQQIVTAVAGPLFSLVLGALVIGTAPLVNRIGRGFFPVFWLWLGHVAVMNFVGYLVIAPFATAGDTGKALRLLGAPDAVTIACCLVGVAGQFALAWSFAIRLRAFAGDVGAERAAAVRGWLVGTALVIVLTLIEVLLAPIEIAGAVLVLVYGFAVAIFAPMQFIFRGRVHAAYEGRAPVLAGKAGPAVTVLVAIVSVLIAALGGVPLWS